MKRYLIGLGFAVITSHAFASNCVSWALQNIINPSARSNHAMTYDESRHVAVMFGGLGSSTKSDTWEWDGNSWTQVNLTGPKRFGHAMVYDSAHHVVVLFGGAYTSFYHDTWTWDGVNWTQVSTTGPSSRYLHSMVYDSGRSRVVMYGGLDSNYISNGETWEWDGSSWTEVSTSGPLPRWETGMAYDSNRGVTVLYGGYDDGIFYDDTWEWDGNTWVEKEPVTVPFHRFGHSMIYDSERQVVMMFGGVMLSDQIDSKTWDYDGTNWQVSSFSGTGPESRYVSAMIYDSQDHKRMLFGGYNDAIIYGDTWTSDACGTEVSGNNLSLHKSGKLVRP